MATGMVMATTASGLAGLSTWRIVTGLGIGGMLAAINAVSTSSRTPGGGTSVCR